MAGPVPASPPHTCAPHTHAPRTHAHARPPRPASCTAACSYPCRIRIRYYLNGVDAYRLKLLLPVPESKLAAAAANEEAAEEDLVRADGGDGGADGGGQGAAAP